VKILEKAVDEPKGDGAENKECKNITVVQQLPGCENFDQIVL
jgi:hypothetical protein